MIEEELSLPERSNYAPLMSTLVYGCKLFNKVWVEEDPQIVGAENVYENEGPFLWLMQHQSHIDFIGLPAIWDRVNKPNFRVVIRNNIYKNQALNQLVDNIIYQSGMFHVMTRQEETSHMSPEAQAQKRLENKAMLERIKAEYANGVHTAIVPEGTSKWDGTVPPIKPGCYKASHVRGQDNEIVFKVQNLPFGNTYDFMAGSQGFFGRKVLIFANIGQPFSYESVSKRPGESNEQYKFRDGDNHMGKVRKSFIDLNTITVSQLGTAYIGSKSTDPTYQLTLRDLANSLEKRVDRLKKLKNVVIDQNLLDDRLDNRVRGFYDTLFEEGYAKNESGVGILVPDRINQEPSSKKTYREENVFRFTLNKLLEVAEHNPSIKEAIAVQLPEPLALS